MISIKRSEKSEINLGGKGEREEKEDDRGNIPTPLIYGKTAVLKGKC